MWLTKLDAEGWEKDAVGGKAYHLAEMTRWGIRVPEFGVLTSASFREWKVSGAFPEKLKREIQASVEGWSSRYFAVRSSMSREDGESSSFAGIFDTFLFIEPQDILEKVEECYRSIESERARMYLSKLGLKPEDLGVAVVIQRMIDAEASGVAFSRAPTGHSGLVYIEAGLGLGEGVVSGLVEVDRYSVDRFGTLWTNEVNTKTSRTLFDPATRKVSVHTVRDTRGHSSAINETTIHSLTREVLKIEKNLGKPADVEWAVDREGQLYLLQARAITQPFLPLDVYIDTNLAESYPGRVSPLTAEFIPRVYEKVIGEAIEMLGATPEQLLRLKPALAGLIHEVDGHLYYNLRNYYTVLAFLPGGDSNIQAWHQMIGGDALQVPFERVEKVGAWQKTKPILHLIATWTRHSPIFDAFVSERFAELEGRKQDLLKMTASREIAAVPEHLMKDIDGWGLTIINDFLVIIGLKILGGIIKRNSLSEQILPVWLKTKDGVDSLGALREIERLSSRFSRPELWSEIENLQTEKPDAEWPDYLQRLDARGWHEDSEQIRAFLREFGERSFEELKLESMPFSEDPVEFFKMLRWTTPASTSSADQRNDGSVHESHLRLSDRCLKSVFVPLTQKAVEARESTRLMRGRYYGLLRLCVLQVSRALKLEHPELFATFGKRDFFFATMSDWSEYAAGKTTPKELAARIVERKGLLPEHAIEYPEQYAASPADKPSYFLSESGPQYAHVEGNELRGLGASPGIAEGIALVLHDPREAMNVSDLESRILVTRSTDPAWIFIMSKCRGLISEKGSLLSHTAIVGREMRIPTVVGVGGATRLIQSGDQLWLDGGAGIVKKC